MFASLYKKWFSSKNTFSANDFESQMNELVLDLGFMTYHQTRSKTYVDAPAAKQSPKARPTDCVKACAKTYQLQGKPGKAFIFQCLKYTAEPKLHAQFQKKNTWFSSRVTRQNHARNAVTETLNTIHG